MYVIDKSFDFCYGHRVWSQELTEEFCEVGDYCTKCRHLHGHQGKLHVYLESDTLIKGMVTDFKHLGWLKDFLDNVIDHKFIIDRNDPWFDHIVNGHIDKSEKAVRRGEEGWPVPGLSLQHDFHLKKIEVLTHRNFHKTEILPVRVPETVHIAGHVLDVSKMSGPEQEFYEGFFLVDFVPTSENLCRWIHGCINAKMTRLDILCTKVEWSETPKSRATYTI